MIILLHKHGIFKVKKLPYIRKKEKKKITKITHQIYSTYSVDGSLNGLNRFLPDPWAYQSQKMAYAGPMPPLLRTSPRRKGIASLLVESGSKTLKLQQGLHSRT